MCGGDNHESTDDMNNHPSGFTLGSPAGGYCMCKKNDPFHVIKLSSICRCTGRALALR